MEGGGWTCVSPLVQMKRKSHLFDGSKLEPQQHSHKLITSARGDFRRSTRSELLWNLWKSRQNIKSRHEVKNKAVFPFDDNYVLLQVVFDLFFSLFYQLWHQRNCLNLGTKRHQRNNEEQGKETAAVLSDYLHLKGADSRCFQQSLIASNKSQTRWSGSHSLVNWCLKFARFFLTDSELTAAAAVLHQRPHVMRSGAGPSEGQMHFGSVQSPIHSHCSYKRNVEDKIHKVWKQLRGHV